MKKANEFSPKQTAVDALGREVFKPYFIVTGLFSLAVNLLLLVAPLYMLQIYDRVLSSGSTDTLVLLTLLAVALLATYAAAEAGRRRLMSLLAKKIDEDLGSKVFKLALKQPDARQKMPTKMANMAAIQNFFSNGLILPFFDLPFTPLFLGAMFLIHPVIGVFGTTSVLILLALAVGAEFSSRKAIEAGRAFDNDAQQFALNLARQQSAILSLGMARAAFQLWRLKRGLATQFTLQGSRSSNRFTSITRGVRQVLQVSILGLGAYLALSYEISAGAIIAGSIIMARALGPIDQIVGMWRQVIRVRQAWTEIGSDVELLNAQEADPTPMPRPDARLEMDSLAIAAPGQTHPLLPAFNLTIDAGAFITIVGPSGAGKSSLLETITGVWTPLEGVVRLGSRDLHSWHDVDRGQYVGYLPQNTEILPGKVKDNIARFTNTPLEKVIEAAQLAGCHDMILRLPEGYDTAIGPGGHHLSAGQKQVVGIARALFGAPVLVVLDEPSANLDHTNVGQLKTALRHILSTGAVIVVSTHDHRLIEASHKVVLLTPNSVKVTEPGDYISAARTAANQAKKLAAS